MSIGSRVHMSNDGGYQDDQGTTPLSSARLVKQGQRVAVKLRTAFTYEDFFNGH